MVYEVISSRFPSCVRVARGIGVGGVGGGEKSPLCQYGPLRNWMDPFATEINKFRWFSCYLLCCIWLLCSCVLIDLLCFLIVLGLFSGCSPIVVRKAFCRLSVLVLSASDRGWLAVYMPVSCKLIYIGDGAR